MVEISLSGSGEGPGWATAPGYSTAGFFAISDKAPSVKWRPSEGLYPRGRVAVLGSAAVAHAGAVTQTYHVDDAYGATGATSTGIIPISADSIEGDVVIVIDTGSTGTFTKSTPPKSANVHFAGGGIHATAMQHDIILLDSTDWQISGTVWAHPKPSASCHVGSNGKLQSCSGQIQVNTWAHCEYGCQETDVPGCWATNSTTHHQKWTGTFHLGTGTISHTTNSAHYMKSFMITMSPPSGHTCGSGSNPHLASSDSGYHTSHMVGKLMSSSSGG